ncbi:MAG: hypothetical protein GY803_27525 [Chloroflexi bacterium]|nr:hypothetical protein [Chloroflexota bacterium]
MVNDGIKSKTITISTLEDDQPVIAFPAPKDKYVARGLWCWLVNNVQPGFYIELGNELSEIVRVSGHKVTPELYKKLMDEEHKGSFYYE